MIKEELENYFDRLWPICRSITGAGLRQSFEILRELIPLELTEVPSGTGVFDWSVPLEWNIRDAYIITPSGEKVADFKKNNLHIVSYSVPVNKKMDFEELKKHIHTIPSQPCAIPYITSYYKENWGFCMSEDQWKKLPREGEYTVLIDSTLASGSLTYGQYVLPGKTTEEVLFSSYLCHPSMANNELSGPLVLAFLYRKLASLSERKYTYRFVLAPETIGIIAFLSSFGINLKKNIRAGYILTCCGDEGKFHYKKSKLQNSLADRAAIHTLTHSGEEYEVIPFAVGGSDERQYCSPGFNMPVGSLMRTPYQRYKEYHTSLDDKSFISFSAMERTVEMYLKICTTLELNDYYINEVPYCEPQMSKYGLYPSSIHPDTQRRSVHNLMHFLTYSDGEHDLISIADMKNILITELEEHVVNCLKAGLVKRG